MWGLGIHHGSEPTRVRCDEDASERVNESQSRMRVLRGRLVMSYPTRPALASTTNSPWMRRSFPT